MEFIKEWGMIAGIAGMAIGVFLILFRELIGKIIFSTLTKKQSYVIIILFMVLVWSFSIFCIVQYYYGKDKASQQVTVLVHGENGKDDLILPTRGKVKLIYGDANVLETINDKGEATFKQIPSQFFNSDLTVEILFFDPGGEPYRAVKPDSLYHLKKASYIDLTVKLYGLDMLKGIVTDFKTGDPIPNVRISILGIDTMSNNYGEFTLLIPREHQRKFQTVRAFKEGYELFELNNIPVQTQSEFPIVMKPKQD
ncbi:MAG: hypothetical protein QM737_14830 [Ferruginibacter sp.]